MTAIVVPTMLTTAMMALTSDATVMPRMKITVLLMTMVVNVGEEMSFSMIVE